MNQSKPQQNGSARRGSKKPALRANKQPKNGSQRKTPINKGEQRVSVPVAQGRVVKGQRPVVRNVGNGDIIISHREYVKDIANTVTTSIFTNTGTLPVNPGLPQTFPWLSTIARSFESYCFEKLKFDFETQSPTTIAGTVMLALDYDASDSAPTSKQQAMAYRSSVRSPSWSDCQHTSLKEDLSKRTSYYVRGGDLSANQDVKLYDVGNMYPCAIGNGTTAALGELYVDYTVKLMTPQLGAVGVGEAVYGIFTGSANSATFSGASSGLIPASVVSSGTTTSVNTWTFRAPWEGYVSVNVVGTGLTGIAPSGTATSLELAEVIDAAATNDVAIYSLSALQNQTFILTVSNTTVSAASAYFAQGDS